MGLELSRDHFFSTFPPAIREQVQEIYGAYTDGTISVEERTEKIKQAMEAITFKEETRGSFAKLVEKEAEIDGVANRLKGKASAQELMQHKEAEADQGQDFSLEF